MENRSSRLPLLFGILLIIAAPVIMVSYIVNKTQRDSGQTHAWATVVSKEKQDTSYVLFAHAEGISSDNFKPIADTVNDGEVNEVAPEEPAPSIDTSDKKVNDAVKRKQQAEGNDTHIPPENTSSTTQNNEGLVQVSVSKADFDKYKKDDRIWLVFRDDDFSKAWIEPEGSKASDDILSWGIISGALFILGIVLVIRSRRRKVQEQDILSTYTSSTMFDKDKKGPTTGGRPM